METIENLTLKIRLAILWLFMAVAMYRCTGFWDVGFIEQFLSRFAAVTEFERAVRLFVIALWWLIPLTMAFLSVTLKDTANRWSNLILGIVFTGLNIYHLIQHLAMGPSAHAILIVGSTIVVTALIAWYAWKWPKPKA